MKLHMGVYVRVTFEFSSIMLTSFRQGVILTSPPPTSKGTPTDLVSKCTKSCEILRREDSDFEKSKRCKYFKKEFKCF